MTEPTPDLTAAPEPEPHGVDLTALDDAQLDQLRVDVLTCQEERQMLAAIPGQIVALAERYEASGGDPAELTLKRDLPEQAAPRANAATADA